MRLPESGDPESISRAGRPDWRSNGGCWSSKRPKLSIGRLGTDHRHSIQAARETLPQRLAKRAKKPPLRWMRGRAFARSSSPAMRDACARRRETRRAMAALVDVSLNEPCHAHSKFGFVNPNHSKQCKDGDSSALRRKAQIPKMSSERHQSGEKTQRGWR